jgi:Holliday junction resolvase RusA-like endonuclease
MPKSWNCKKKQRHHGTLHRSKPDTDNLCKALMDSIYRDRNDSEVADYRAIKLWAYEGAIALYQMPAIDYSMF